MYGETTEENALLVRLGTKNWFMVAFWLFRSKALEPFFVCSLFRIHSIKKYIPGQRSRQHIQHLDPRYPFRFIRVIEERTGPLSYDFANDQISSMQGGELKRKKEGNLLGLADVTRHCQGRPSLPRGCRVVVYHLFSTGDHL